MRPLEKYQRKRHFEGTDGTPEPRGKRRASRTRDVFVVQKHRARQLHYDFRLEVDGVLRSWAVPKGPSLDPSDKRMAAAVEDHPLDYADFEGIIPEGEYGAGTVMVWDRGTYEVEDGTDVDAALRKGRLKFLLKGKKLRGAWALVRIRPRTWLLIKHRDEFASDADIEHDAPRSVASRRLLAQIAADEGGDVERAATGDPADGASTDGALHRIRGRHAKQVKSDLKDVKPSKRGAAFPHDNEQVSPRRHGRRRELPGSASDHVPRLVPRGQREARGGHDRGERHRKASARA
jgi:bifunctional non-homologous end joining protein LigD